MSLLGAALAIAGGFWVVPQITKKSLADNSVSEVRSIAVETFKVQHRAVPDTLEFSGTIQPITRAVLSTRVMGRITALPFEEGDRVEKDQVIARIDVLDIVAQTSQARSGVAQSQAELSRTQATLKQLESQRLEAQAALTMAQLNQKRMAQLHKDGAVSRSQLDQANTELDIAKARVEQAESGIRQAQAGIRQSQAAITQAQAGVAAASANVSYGIIRAPFKGIVTQKLAYEGETTALGTPLVKLENTDRLQLEISVPEADLRFVQLNQPVLIKIDALGRTFSGKVKQIVPAADPNSRSFIVKVPLKNTGYLISGMFGRIELTRGTRETITIPVGALVRRGQLEGCYVVGPDNQAELRLVKTGKVRDGHIEIASGLVDGDRVITSHLQQLSDGQPVFIKG